MQAHSKPVKPALLGAIGRDHFEARFERARLRDGVLRLSQGRGRRRRGHPLPRRDCLRLARRQGGGRAPAGHRRQLVARHHQSVPRSSAATARASTTILSEQRVGRDEPVIFVLHVACPRVEYLDRGKSARGGAVMKGDKLIIDAVEGVTKKWAKQRKAEERAASARANRYYAMTRQRAGHDRATRPSMCCPQPGRRHPATASIRPRPGRSTTRRGQPLQDITGKPVELRLFHADAAARLSSRSTGSTGMSSMTRAATSVEPHTQDDRCRSARCRCATISQKVGTTDARRACRRSRSSRRFPDQRAAESLRRHPVHREGGLQAAARRGADRRALRSRHHVDQGHVVTASRTLVEELCGDHDIPLLVLHDFDISGFTIAGTLQESTRRYQFSSTSESSTSGCGSTTSTSGA